MKRDYDEVLSEYGVATYNECISNNKPATTDREEFEAFFVKEFSGKFAASKKTMLLYDENTDQYMNGFVNDSYKTWKAAKAQAVSVKG